MPKASDYNTEKGIVVSVSGDPKTGKTFFAMSAPSPLFIHAFDLASFKRVRPHMTKDQLEDTWVEEYPPHEFGLEKDDPKYIKWATAVWEQFVTASRMAIKDGYKTSVLDTETLWWDRLQDALVPNDEKSNRSAGLKYVRANAEVEAYYDACRDNGMNLILLHHMKEKWGEYFDDNGKKRVGPLGKYIPDMHKRTPRLADVSVRTLKPLKEGTTEFRMLIQDCGINPLAEGIYVDSFGGVTWENFRLAIGV